MHLSKIGSLFVASIQKPAALVYIVFGARLQILSAISCVNAIDEIKACKAKFVADCWFTPLIGAGKVARYQLALSDLTQNTTSSALKRAVSSFASFSVCLKHGFVCKSYIICG